MKKITALLLVVMMLVSVFTLAAYAEVEYNTDCATIVKNKVLKGTPVVDGKLDAIYTESLTVKLHGPAESYALQNGATETTATGTAYALYDDNYVYVFFEVTDTTLLKGDPEYVDYHPHPHLNDAIEFRIGDDLEDHFAPYDGSNDAHHLFYADAHGTRYTCYEESMGDDVEKLFNATRIEGNKYYVECAVPVQRAFKEGEMIQFNFQIDDLQDDLDTFAAVGLGRSPTKIVDFYCGGSVSGQQAPVTPEPKPEPKPVDPDPVVTPDPEPEVTPDPEPEVTPDPVEPEEPAEEEGSNLGLIIGIVAAVVVVAVVVIVLVSKKKK